MVTSTKRHHREGSNILTPLLDEVLTEVGEFVVADMDAITFHFSNAGNALDQFVVSGNSIKDGTYEILFNGATDFTSPAGIMIGASGDLTSLADAATGWFLLYPKGFYAIKIEIARASGDDTTLTTNSGGS